MIEPAQRPQAAQSLVGDLVHFDEILAHFDRERRMIRAREHSHQQYLAKNPDGYCGLGGTGVSCPVGLAT